MKIQTPIFFLLFLPFVVAGQTRNVFLSAPYDKLILGETTIKQTKKILGKPARRRVPPIIQHRWEKRIELDYAESKSTLRFGRRSKILYNITLDSASNVTINNEIKLSVADTILILKTFGTPRKIEGKPIYRDFYYKLKPYDVYFSFDERGILYEASFFEHDDSDTGVNRIDTTKMFFGVYVRHVEDELSNVTVNFVSQNDTISVVTDKNGNAHTIIPKRPYPKIVIKEKGYEDFEKQITDTFINETYYVYKHINLIALADSVYRVKPCNSANIYSVNDSLLNKTKGKFPQPDKVPEYKDGLSGFIKTLDPKSIKHKYHFYHDCFISIAFLVNCDGEIGNFQDITNSRGVNETYANEMLAAIKKMPKSWQPAIKDNKPVDCYQVLSFKLSKGKLRSISYSSK